MTISHDYWDRIRLAAAWLAILTLAGIWLLLVTACDALPATQAALDGYVETLDGKIAELEKTGTADSQALAGQVKEVRDKVADTAEDLAELATAAAEPLSTEAIGTALMPLAPWAGTGVVLLGGLLEGWRRNRQKRSALEGLVGAIDHAKRDRPALAEAFHAAGDSLRSRMPDVTKRLVEKIRG